MFHALISIFPVLKAASVLIIGNQIDINVSRVDRKQDNFIINFVWLML